MFRIELVTWGIIVLLFAFFIGPLARGTIARLGISLLYLISTLFFISALLQLESPLYYHLSPQTFALFDLSFVADPLSLLLSCLITGLGSLIIAYSAFYMDDTEGPRFFTLINFFTISMLGLVLSHNLLGIFIFWEFTGLCSFFLISFDGANAEARKAALQSLLVTAMGGLAMLCGFLILGGMGESYDLLQIRIPQSHPWMGMAILLIFLGALTKSAQFPFHFWLPNASTAPSPASAFLHSATMVKAGIFLLLRLSPLISGHPYWHQILIPCGMITALLASLLILFEKDLKKILAYTTLSSLGLIVYLIGKNSADAYYIAILWIFAHALYKAPLFLLCGNIERFTGERDVTKLSALYPRMKGSLLVALLGAASLLGLPPLLSYKVKSEFFQLFGSSALEFAGMIFVFAAAGSVGFTLIQIFLKDSHDSTKRIGRFFDDNDDPALLWLPALATLLITFMMGIRYIPFADYLKETLSQVIPFDFQEIQTGKLSKNFAYLASGAILFLSLFFAFLAQNLRERTPRKFRIKKIDFQISATFLFDSLFDGLQHFSKFIFSKLQNGRLDLYTTAFFGFLLFLLSQIPGLDTAFPVIPTEFQNITPFEVALIASMIISALMTLKVDSNFSALAVLGIIGFGNAYLYLINAAPDLALTQFLIELLTLLLLVLCFRYFPSASYNPRSRYQKYLRGGIAGIVGTFVGVLSFFASSAVRPHTLTQYFSEKSLAYAHGRNVVSTILTDFRGFDTLGEITVLALAAVGVASLLQKKKRARPESTKGEHT